MKSVIRIPSAVSWDALPSGWIGTIYSAGVNPSGAWAVMQEGKPLHTDYTMEKEWNWIGRRKTWRRVREPFFGSGYDRIFYTVFPSSQYNFSYICVINSKMLWRLNRSALIGDQFCPDHSGRGRCPGILCGNPE